ncbi:hypothetical protein APR04_002593 [Promicromonospora umidemergens]|uniref:Uncharacterized protein n=1 Tax=Promicromonospora umidemergens TaxID=629679 RepID=A0ABP8WW98_9MICO|nr:hypothetical protein [Promicromonospora umidemergens]MCP2283685.1 hypothetical protein [Promicromonospora umidemergens]
MAEPTVQQQPVEHRLGLLVRAVPRLRRKARAGAGVREPGLPPVPARQGVQSLHLDLVVVDDDGAAAVLERILDALRPGDRVYVVGPPAPAEPRVDDRPFTIWA